MHEETKQEDRRAEDHCYNKGGAKSNARSRRSTVTIRCAQAMGRSLRRYRLRKKVSFRKGVFLEMSTF